MGLGERGAARGAKKAIRGKLRTPRRGGGPAAATPASPAPAPAAAASTGTGTGTRCGRDADMRRDAVAAKGASATRGDGGVLRRVTADAAHAATVLRRRAHHTAQRRGKSTRRARRRRRHLLPDTNHAASPPPPPRAPPPPPPPAPAAAATDATDATPNQRGVVARLSKTKQHVQQVDVVAGHRARRRKLLHLTAILSLQLRVPSRLSGEERALAVNHRARGKPHDGLAIDAALLRTTQHHRL